MSHAKSMIVAFSIKAKERSSNIYM